MPEPNELWQKILGPLPIGTIACFQDNRFEKGYIKGKVVGYFQYYFWDKKWERKISAYSYKIEVQEGPFKGDRISKRPCTLITVLNGQKRKKDVRR